MSHYARLIRCAIAVPVFLCVSSLRAAYIGEAWSVPASTAENVPAPGNVPGPGALEVATVTVSGIDFSGDAPGAYTLGGFLSSGGDLLTVAYLNGAGPSTNLDNTLWDFTGTADFTSGQQFTVTHDDGINLYVAGNPVLLAGGPTPPSQQTFSYNGPSGSQNFEFIYAECCGGTADFITDLVPTVTSTPEPGTSALLPIAGGLIFAARVRIRKRASSPTAQPWAHPPSR